MAETANPNAVIEAPKIAIGRIPTRSAMRPIMMPPRPVPNQISEAANATTDRSVQSDRRRYP